MRSLSYFAFLVPLLNTFTFLSSVPLHGKYDGHQLVKVDVWKAEHLRSIGDFGDQHKVNFIAPPRKAGIPVVFSVPAHKSSAVHRFLADNNLKNSSKIQDLQSLIRKERDEDVVETFSSVDDFRLDKYHDLNSIYKYLLHVEGNYSIAERFNLAHKTAESRNVTGIKIGSSSKKPIIVLECGIHAREWVSPATCIYIIDKLVKNYSKRKEIEALVDDYEWNIIPVTNPDGYQHTWTKDRLWRKNRRPSDLDGCSGVDLNRNFDSDWKEHLSSSTDPCSLSYSGPFAFSEPETKGLRDFVTKVQDRILNYYSIHSYGQLWMFPLGYGYKKDVDYNEQNEASKVAVKAIQEINGTAYIAGQISSTIYEVSGSSSDYLYAKQGIKYPFAIELRDYGKFGFTLPSSEIIPTASEFFAGLVAAVNYTKHHT